MILNGIEISPESLKAQLEEHGWEVKEKTPKFKHLGTVVDKDGRTWRVQWHDGGERGRLYSIEQITARGLPAAFIIPLEKSEMQRLANLLSFCSYGESVRFTDVSDELIQAYEELYQATLAIEDTVPIYTRKQGQFERFVKGRNSVNAIKSRTAGK